MTTLVFLLEEASAAELLKGLVPRLLPHPVEARYLVFEGKQDLEGNLKRKIRGWLGASSGFVVLRDQDAAPCVEVKRRLADLADQSGSAPVLVRVACRELESWILGDWQAIADAFDRPQLAQHSRKALYRDPDRLSRPVEEIRKFIPEYQKREGARRVGPLLDPARNRSVSFGHFCRGVVRLAEALVDSTRPPGS